MCCASLESPRPFVGLLRGTCSGSVLDWLGLAHTSLAPSSCRVLWGVMLPEEACAVVGEWCGCVPVRLACIAAPPASQAAAPLHALDTKSVWCTFPCMLLCLWRIIKLLQAQPCMRSGHAMRSHLTLPFL
jgi:hypothetical protein